MTAISVTMATAARTPSDMGRIYFVVMRQSPLEIVANVRSS